MGCTQRFILVVPKVNLCRNPEFIKDVPKVSSYATYSLLFAKTQYGINNYFIIIL